MQRLSDLDLKLLRAIAGKVCDLSEVAALLRAGANPNAVSQGISGTGRDLDTPLRMAIERENIALTALLLQHGALIDLTAREISLDGLDEYNIFAPPRQPDIVFARLHAEMKPPRAKAVAIYKLLLAAGGEEASSQPPAPVRKKTVARPH